ncbi:maleylacetoacetate isomerase [Solimicrobium silvestre]|uniref:MaiA: maleylacetoacetate isomerase n=1 Tax=Solimicrobium silvestre TaxID=2099400 RepID=A0A2S9GXA8_9BURK|nr:maleylacetoacetate isomerase [Solimicrobium silvestre]PRC92296.1 maiA: maleylacetoacetate isomerase [Solimicrobium silvestre]
MKLYSYFRSSASFRVRIVLNLKQLPYDYDAVHLVKQGGAQHTPAYLALNPMGAVPSLDDDGKVLTQSMAMCEYLEELHPQPALLPVDAFERAWVRSVCNLVACDIHPVNNLRILKYLTGPLALTEEQKTAWYHHWIAQGFTALEKLVAQKAGTYCCGDEPSLADAFVVPQIWNAARFACPMEDYPTLRRIYENAMLLPAFEQAAPAAQPDAE